MVDMDMMLVIWSSRLMQRLSWWSVMVNHHSFTSIFQLLMMAGYTQEELSVPVHGHLSSNSNHQFFIPKTSTQSEHFGESWPHWCDWLPLKIWFRLTDQVVQWPITFTLSTTYPHFTNTCDLTTTMWLVYWQHDYPYTTYDWYVYHLSLRIITNHHEQPSINQPPQLTSLIIIMNNESTIIGTSWSRSSATINQDWSTTRTHNH